jgi:hypothetical protein
MRRLKVLLLTTKELLPPDTKVIGDTLLYPFGDKEVEDYIELLSACNIPFDIKYNDEFSFDDIISHDYINYSTIILTLPAEQLSENNINILNKVSHDFGVSLIASYNRVNEMIKHLFGIHSIQGRRYGFPCTISIQKHQAFDVNIEHEITLGVGWKLQLHKGGLRRHPMRYLKKHFKTLWEQVWSYMKVKALPGAEILAVIKGKTDPAMITYQYGKGVNYYIALQSDSFLDRCNSLHSIIRECIRENSGWGMVNVNLENTMILRMDDPGTAERVYLKGYDTKILGKEDWEEIIKLLKKYEAKLSVMYIPLWLDDGNFKNGRLFIQGKEITERKQGAMYYSKNVVFLKNTGNNKTLTYDYTSEFLALKEGLRSGWIDIESHGLTHVDPNVNRWLEAKDRYSNFKWYVSEFRHVCENRDCTEIEQSKVAQESAKKIEEVFRVSPSTITPTGHEQSRNSEEIAHINGYKLFSSDYHSLCKNGVIIRNDKIRSIFFEATEPDSSFADAGYPVVGVFHDYDIVRRGVTWLEEIIRGWGKHGIKRFMTLRELAGYLCASFEAYQDHDVLYVEVDISNTGDVSNHRESRYFSNHTMDIEMTLPQGRILDSVAVDGAPWNTFEYDQPKKQLKLILPPFHTKDKQEVVVRFQTT